VTENAEGWILFIIGLLVLSLLALGSSYESETRAHEEDCRKFLSCERGAGQVVNGHCMCVAPAQEIRR